MACSPTPLTAWSEEPSAEAKPKPVIIPQPPPTTPAAASPLVPPLRKNSASKLRSVSEAPAAGSRATGLQKQQHDFLKIEVNKRHAILPQAKAWLETNQPGSPGGTSQPPQMVPLRPAQQQHSPSREHALVLTLPAPEQEWASSRPPRRASPPRRAAPSDISQIPQRGNTPGATSRARESACSIHDCGRSSFSCMVASHSQSAPSRIVPLATSTAPNERSGAPARLSFGDPYHHVDAPRSPIKGSKPLHTPSAHAGTPGAFGQLGAYKYNDQSALFAATPVPPTPPRPPGSEYLPDKPSRIRPPAMPTSLPEAFTSGQTSLDADLGPVVVPPPPPMAELALADGPTQKISTIRSPFPPEPMQQTPQQAQQPQHAHPTLQASSSSASLDPQQPPQRGMVGGSGGSGLRRSRSEMALRPLRSVGRFSTAIDPSKVSKWQYNTLQKTHPEAYITNRAKEYHPDYEIMRMNSAASLKREEQERTLTEAERRFHYEKESLRASLDRGGGGAKTNKQQQQQAASDPAASLDRAVDDKAAAAASRSSAMAGSSNRAGGVRAAHIDEKSLLAARQKPPATTREEAAAFIAEAEHFIEFAEQALVHVSPSGTRRMSAMKGNEKGGQNALGVDPDGGKNKRRALGSLPERAAREAQPLSREASREGGGPRVAAMGGGAPSGSYRKPLYEQEEEEPFPRQLISKLEGVPGVPMQILRLMRRGDWRVRA